METPEAQDAAPSPPPGASPGLSGAATPSEERQGYLAEIRDLKHRCDELGEAGSPATSASAAAKAGTQRSAAGSPGWEEDTPYCGVCGEKFSKGKMGSGLRPHHCRICGRCVCGPCSPSSVELAGSRGTHRACTPCISIVSAQCKLLKRLALLGQQLRLIHDFEDSKAVTEPKTLEEAVGLCEDAIVPLKVAHARATDTVLEVGERLRALGTGEESEGVRRQGSAMVGLDSEVQQPIGRNLELAVSFCRIELEGAEEYVRQGRQAAAAPLEERARRAEAELEEERHNRKELDKRLAERMAQEIAEKEFNLTSDGAMMLSRSFSQGSSNSFSNRVEWEADTSNCTVCHTSFGKVGVPTMGAFGVRRHHCRNCGRCVCANCSPSVIQLEGQRGTHRVCTLCIANVQHADVARDRLAQLGQQLRVIHNPETPAADDPSGLMEALAFCEGALLPLKASHLRSMDAVLDVAARLRTLGVAQALASEHPGPEEAKGVSAQPFIHNLEEAVGFCKEAIGPVEVRVSRAEAELAKAQTVQRLRGPQQV